MNKKNNRGFTLIELIVVIAIIGILAAILIPRYSGYTDKAKNAVDFANLATLNLMTDIYRNDFPEINIDTYDGEAVMEALVPEYLAEEMTATGVGAAFAWVGDSRKSWVLTATGSDGQTQIVYTPGEYFSQIGSDGITRLGTIYGYDGRGGTNIVIPKEISGVAITTINQDAFNKNISKNLWDKLLSVILPDTLLKISGGAFHSNTLTAIDIPDSVTYLGANAFYGNQLTQVSLGTGLTEIKGGAFASNKLTEIALPPTIKIIGDGAFQSNNITTITIGDNVSFGNTASLGVNGSKFNTYYNSTGMTAGTYIYENGAWTKI